MQLPSGDWYTTLRSYHSGAEGPPLAASPAAHRVGYKMAILVHKCLNERAPEYLITDCCWAGSRRSGTRSAGRQMLEVVRMNTSFGDRSFAAAAPRVWNGLPDVVRNSALSEDAFAKLLKTYLMNCM